MQLLVKAVTASGKDMPAIIFWPRKQVKVVALAASIRFVFSDAQLSVAHCRTNSPRIFGAAASPLPGPLQAALSDRQRALSDRQRLSYFIP